MTWDSDWPKPPIPEGLCGVGDCVFTPHGDTPHTWEK